jgi:hypothetical protein
MQTNIKQLTHDYYEQESFFNLVVLLSFFLKKGKNETKSHEIKSKIFQLTIIFIGNYYKIEMFTLITCVNSNLFLIKIIVNAGNKH